MKWGVRKDRGIVSSSTARNVANGSSDAYEFAKRQKLTRQQKKALKLQKKIDAQHAKNASRAGLSLDSYKKIKAANEDYSYEKSSEWKSLKKQHDKAYDKYFNSDGDNPSLEKAFAKAEKNLLKHEGRSVANNMLKASNFSDAKKFAEHESKYTTIRYSAKNANEFVEEYADNYYNTHRA